MRSPGAGGFLGLGHTLRSLTMSPVDSALQQLHRQARGHLAAGGSAVPVRGKPKSTPAPAEEFLLPKDIEPHELISAINAKLRVSPAHRRCWNAEPVAGLLCRRRAFAQAWRWELHEGPEVSARVGLADPAEPDAAQIEAGGQHHRKRDWDARQEPRRRG